MSARLGAAVVWVAWLVCATPAVAQSSRVAVTGGGGWAGFLDDGRIDHGVTGGGLDWRLTPHLAVGPEVLYMVGPGDDRDLFVLGIARVGFRPFDKGLVPFLTAGGGLVTHSDTYGGGVTSRSTEGAFVFGGGVRWNVSPRVFIAPDVTVGWEPHLRTSVMVGVRL